MKITSLSIRRNPTNINVQKLKTQNELTNVYLKEQTEYIQNQINKNRDLAEDRQSRIAWQTVNKLSWGKSTARAKLKATSQGEQIHLWKHFENLLAKPLKVTDEPITKIISNQLDMKLRHYIQEELNSVLKKKLKTGKQRGLMKYLQKYGRARNLTTYCNTIIPGTQEGQGNPY